MWGHIIYHRREEIADKYHGVFFLFFFLFINLVRCSILSYGGEKGSAYRIILFWYSSFGMLCALSLYLFIYSMIRKSSGTKKVSKLICFFGKHTFSIYLLHMMVREYMTLKGLDSLLTVIETKMPWGSAVFHQTCYYIVAATAIFLICLVMSCLISFFGSLIRINKLKSFFLWS